MSGISLHDTEIVFSSCFILKDFNQRLIDVPALLDY